jgi:hypothetical protein
MSKIDIPMTILIILDKNHVFKYHSETAMKLFFISSNGLRWVGEEKRVSKRKYCYSKI